MNYIKLGTSVHQNTQFGEKDNVQIRKETFNTDYNSQRTFIQNIEISLYCGRYVARCQAVV